jgi:hypothetical protein
LEDIDSTDGCETEAINSISPTNEWSDRKNEPDIRTTSAKLYHRNAGELGFATFYANYGRHPRFLGETLEGPKTESAIQNAKKTPKIYDSKDEAGNSTRSESVLS